MNFRRGLRTGRVIKMVEGKNDIDTKALNRLRKDLKKLGWDYKEKTAFKVVARKVGDPPGRNGKESVFLIPGYAPSQIERYLLYLGWEYVAGVKFNSPEEAKDISADEIKVLGLKAKGNG